MAEPGSTQQAPTRIALPERRDLYYGGQWHAPQGGYLDNNDPANGHSLGLCANANAADVDAAVQAGHAAFQAWRRVRPLERAAMLRRIAQILRENAAELAMLDAVDCGNPVREMANDAIVAAAQIDYFAGLVTEIKGETIPMGPGVVNMTVREPYGVCARIVAYNHPLMFVAGKLGPVLASGNTAVMKPPHQAPLSSYRLVELTDGVLPPGVLNIVTGGEEAGRALVDHPLVPHVALIGSVPTGRAIARGAAERLKQVSLELGGKNACIVYPDADVPRAARGAVAGMNFSWCGQSCGSTSRLFIHDAVYDQVLAKVLANIAYFRPGIPTDMATTMGALVSRAQHDKVMHYIQTGVQDGARLLCGGRVPEDPALAGGYFVEPTVFGDVTSDMRIAREEIFGPVLSVIRWHDEEDMLAQVNAVDYGLTCSIWTTSLQRAHEAASRVEAGYVWINNASRHFIGAPFGGYKQSGLGREESLDELMAYTQVKNINITLAPE